MKNKAFKMNTDVCMREKKTIKKKAKNIRRITWLPYK